MIGIDWLYNAIHYYIYILYLDLRNDTHNCPFARFLARFLTLGRISCEGHGNGHFLTTVVNFVFGTF